MDRVQALGGVESAAYARITPFSYRTYSSAPIEVDGYEAPPDQQPTVEYNEVSPAYFRTLGIPFVSGREFTRADDENAAPVAVVDETMVAKYWHGSGRKAAAGQGSRDASGWRGEVREIRQPPRE